jgi:carbonic anhydrase
MCTLDPLFANNRAWAAQRVAQEPDFFTRLARQQAPRYMWIGCSDSRVPANEILGLDPGEVFVHRNVANLVVHSDLNFLSVLQFAVEVLKVEHVMVVGHYGCGGVAAVAEQRSVGLADNWLRHVEDVAPSTASGSRPLSTDCARCRLVELNARAGGQRQPHHHPAACPHKGQPVEVHGLVYGLANAAAPGRGERQRRAGRNERHTASLALID